MTCSIRDFYLKSFSQDNFLIVNKKLISKLGPRKAIFISNLIDKNAYFEKKHPEYEGWFFLIHEHQVEQTGMSEKVLRAIKKFFINIGCLKIERRGVPSKEWYWIEFEKLDEIVEILNKNDVTALTERAGLEVTKRAGLYKETREIYPSDIETNPSGSNKIILPKRNRPVPKSLSPREQHSIPRGTPCWSFIHYWNDSPGKKTRHNLAGKSKILLRVKRYYNQLKAGIFFRDKEWDSNWLLKNPKIKQFIDEQKNNEQKYTDIQLKELLSQSLLYFVEGYWPPNKDNIPSSLAEFIYNPRNQNSWFIKSVVDKPSLLRKPSLNSEQEWDPDATDLFLDLMGENRNNDNCVRSINRFVEQMKKCWELTSETFGPENSMSGHDFYYEYNSWPVFVEAYGTWLKEQNWINGIDSPSFRIESGLVNHWFQELKKQFDYGDENFRIIKS